MDGGEAPQNSSCGLPQGCQLEGATSSWHSRTDGQAPRSSTQPCRPLSPNSTRSLATREHPPRKQGKSHPGQIPDAMLLASLTPRISATGQMIQSARSKRSRDLGHPNTSHHAKLHKLHRNIFVLRTVSARPPHTRTQRFSTTQGGPSKWTPDPLARQPCLDRSCVGWSKPSSRSPSRRTSWHTWRTRCAEHLAHVYGMRWMSRENKKNAL